MSRAMSKNHSAPCKGVVLSLVNPLATSVSAYLPSLRVWSEIPYDIGRFFVKAVGRERNVSQVAQSVVSFVSVDVVNHIRLFAVSKKPANPMGKPRNAFIHDAPISSFSVNRACNRPRLAGASINFPSQIAR